MINNKGHNTIRPHCEATCALQKSVTSKIWKLMYRHCKVQ